MKREGLKYKGPPTMTSPARVYASQFVLAVQLESVEFDPL